MYIKIGWGFLRFFFFNLKKHLFLFLYLAVPDLSCSTQDLGSSLVACGPFSCGMQTLSCFMRNLVPKSEVEPELRVQSLSHRTTGEVS